MSNAFSLDGRTILVIGGSGGIGQALCRGLAAAGAKVAIASSGGKKVDAAVSKLGQGATGHVCDATDFDALPGLIDEVASAHGRLDGLINCQGTNVNKPVSEFTREEYYRIMRINLDSVFFASVAAHARFVAQGGGGAIVNIASLAAHRGWPGATVYGASKHAVLGLTRGIAGEWAADGVRVNSISPGFFMTDINRERMGEARKERALARTPYARFGEVDELAGAAVYLLSDAAGFVTGTDVAVDGGFLGVGI